LLVLGLQHIKLKIKN